MVEAAAIGLVQQLRTPGAIYAPA